jgi:uncharacterized protein (DUF1501 family)
MKNLLTQTRRSFFRSAGLGLETMALGSLLGLEGASTKDPLAPKKPHFPGKAKSVIFLFMEGAPSQMDLFDPKPALAKWQGKPLPESLIQQTKLAFIKKDATVLPSARVFQRHGQSGMEFSDYIPNIASCADDICMIRSMYTEAFNHHPGQLLLMTGFMQAGRPSLGAWVTYGLGSESRNLPGFVVLSSGAGTSGGATNFGPGFLPSMYQGTMFRNAGDPILYLSNPQGVSDNLQRAALDAIRDLNQERQAETGDEEIAARINSYELAFRMQMSAPELLDFSKESKETLELYGINNEKSRAFGTNCLLARRMVERGVRYVMLMHASWDQHTYLNRDLKKNCEITDAPTAALIKDLKRRGLLDSTIVVWGGEFGRTPMVEQRITSDPENMGRDHHPIAYSMFVAGGGIKGGQVIGKTDELGFNIVEDKVHVHDLQATLLHCLGFDHERLTYHYMGRDFRLTDVAGGVVRKMLA